MFKQSKIKFHNLDINYDYVNLEIEIKYTAKYKESIIKNTVFKKMKILDIPKNLTAKTIKKIIKKNILENIIKDGLDSKINKIKNFLIKEE